MEGWKGFRPDRISGLYPDEQATDFAFLPFGGGARKCVGDQFAMLEVEKTQLLFLFFFKKAGWEGPVLFPKNSPPNTIFIAPTFEVETHLC